MKQRLLFGAMLLPLSLAALAIDAPYELNKSDYTGTDITLTWDAVPGATGYLVSVYSLGESMTGQKAQNHTLNKENPTYNSPAVPGYLTEASFTFSVTGTNGVANENTPFLIFREHDAYGNMSSIIRSDIYMGQLAAYNELGTDIIFPSVLSPETSSIQIEAAYYYNEEAVGEMNISGVSYSYRPYVYLVKDAKITDGTTYKAGNLDPTMDYYAMVRAVAGDETSAPAFARIECLTPSETTGASAFTETSYTANWVADPKATAYTITNYEVLIGAEDGSTEVVLLEDDFSKATEGTFDAPVENITPDNYTTVPGWYINSAIIADGMLGTFGGTFIQGRPYGGGYIYSPEIGFNSGEATVSVKLQGIPEDIITVYTGEFNAANATVLTVPDNGIVEEVITLPNASVNGTVRFESKSLKKFMLDYIKISQKLEPGKKAYNRLSKERVANTTSHTFTGLDPKTSYGFSVTAHRNDFFGVNIDGVESAIHEVGSFAGVENVAADNAGEEIETRYTDLSGRTILTPAPGTVVIRTEIHADGSASHTKFIAR